MIGSRKAQRKTKQVTKQTGRGGEQPLVPGVSGLEGDILALQREVGNQTVSELLASGAGRRMPGNGAGRGTLWAPTLVQAKLVVGPPGDEYEREADETAKRVVSQNGTERNGRPTVAGPALSGFRPIHTANRTDGLVQRQPIEESTEEEEDELLAGEAGVAEAGEEGEEEESAEEEELGGEELLQAKAVSPRGLRLSANLSGAIAGLRGRGQPLSDSVRGFFEPRLRRDLHRVRVHTGSQAAGLADEIGARAFTVGQDVVFGRGEYAPHSPAGRRLLAHELTHVVQQGERTGGTVRLQPKSKPKTTQYRRAYNRYRAKGGKLSFGEWLKQRIGTGKYGPGAIRRHHTVPQEFMRKLPTGAWKHPAVANRLQKLGIDIDRLVIDIPENIHKRIHQGKWNRELQDWFSKNPSFTKKDLQQQVNRMLDKHNVPRRYRPTAEKYGRTTRKGGFYERRRAGKQKYQRRAAAQKKAAAKAAKPTKAPTVAKTTTPKVTPPATATTGKAPQVKTGKKVPRLNLKKIRFPKLRFGGLKGGNLILLVGSVVLEYFIGNWLAERAQKEMEADIERRINALAPQVEKQLESALKAKEAELVRLLEQNPDRPIYANVKYRLTFHVTKSGIAATETSREVFSVDLVAADYGLEPWKATDKVQTEDVTGCGGAATGQVFELEHHPIVAAESFPVQELFEAEE